MKKRKRTKGKERKKEQNQKGMKEREDETNKYINILKKLVFNCERKKRLIILPPRFQKSTILLIFSLIEMTPHSHTLVTHYH
jgi:hypothetical protein